MRNAKVNFPPEAANDAGNLDDLRQFTTPGDVRRNSSLAIVERAARRPRKPTSFGGRPDHRGCREGKQYVASVRFDGLIRESREAAAEAFSEVWHLAKPRDGSGGWVVAGIQQLQ